MNKRIVSFITVFLLTLAVGFFYYTKPVLVDPVYPDRDAVAGMSSRGLPMGSPIVGDRVPLSDVEEHLSYAVPSFEYLPVSGEIIEVWVSSDSVPLREKSLALVFSNGLTAIIHREYGKVDVRALTFELPSQFQLVKVNSSDGIGKDPGEQVLSDGSTSAYTGSIRWQNGDYMVALYGDYPLDVLIKVAENVIFRDQ